MNGEHAAQRLGDARAERIADEILQEARDTVPRDVQVERVAGGIVLRGRALARRALYDARLRGIGR